MTRPGRDVTAHVLCQCRCAALCARWHPPALCVGQWHCATSHGPAQRLARGIPGTCSEVAPGRPPGPAQRLARGVPWTCSEVGPGRPPGPAQRLARGVPGTRSEVGPGQHQLLHAVQTGGHRLIELVDVALLAALEAGDVDVEPAEVGQ